MSWSVTADVARYDEACDWFLKRIVITGVQARALDDRLKNEAFWVGGGLQLEQVQRVFDKINVAIEKGTPFEEWRKAVRDELRNDAHAETVFRNASQRAYNAGRFQQMTEPSVLQFRPFWMFDAVLDSRTTTACNSRDRTILPADDPWWDSNFPPLHHRCRSSVRNLRKSEAERKGISASGPPDLPPAGWGQSPRGNPSPPKPKPEKHDPALLTTLERKQRTAKPRKPRPKSQHEAKFWVDKYAHYGDAAPAIAWGKAAVERGLDMRVDAVLNQLRPLSDVPGVRAMMDSLAGLEQTATIRESAGDIDPRRRAAAGLAGHLKRIKPRTDALRHPDLVSEPEGARALRFFSVVTDKSVKHPGGEWTFRKQPGRAFCRASAKLIQYDAVDGTLEHEWSHSLEDLNPKLLRRASEFLRRRTGGEKLRKLRDLTGLKYESWELAKPDDFLDAYQGKFYERHGGDIWATEITSMGVELLAAGRTKWGSLEMLVEKDPDLFQLILGQLAHQ